MRLKSYVAGTAAISATLLFAAGPAAGQTGSNGAQTAAGWSAPRTSWGDPDLQGIYNVNDNVGVPVERPERFGTRTVLTDEEFAARQKEGERAARDDKAERRQLGPEQTGDGPEHWYERGRTSRRTSLVVDPADGRIPLNEEMKKRAKDWDSQRYGNNTSSFLDFDLWDRCITKGFPTVMIPQGYNNSFRIFQAPGYVAILYEIIHDVRIIPTDGRPHVESSVGQWWGDSRGHWEGDTLVVDVTNFTDKIRGNQQPAGPYRGGGHRQHIVERFKRTGPNSMEYRVTLEDPDSFTKPWTMDIAVAKDDNYRMFEYACHEGNYSMVNMLSGARAMEKAAAEKKSTSR
jgi:hypothetical protein